MAMGHTQHHAYQPPSRKRKMVSAQALVSGMAPHIDTLTRQHPNHSIHIDDIGLVLESTAFRPAQLRENCHNRYAH